MDSEAWYEVTPENIAEHIAARAARKHRVHDCCCGVGGNSIQFALKGLKVAAVDLNAARLRMLRKNASLYGVDESIACVHRDVFDYLADQPVSRRRDEVFFISPPWGGEASSSKSSISVDELPINLGLILPLALMKFGAVILHLPKQFILDDIFSILRNEGISYVEVESIYYSKPVRHLKCHVVYVDSVHALKGSMLIGPRYHRMKNLIPFLRNDRFSSLYAQLFLKVHYSGRYVLRCLSILRERMEFSNGNIDQHALGNTTFP